MSCGTDIKLVAALYLPPCVLGRAFGVANNPQDYVGI
jgi:hypothetical protein